MRNFTTWLIVIFGFMFWGFRVAGAFAAGTGMDFMIKPRAYSRVSCSFPDR